MKKISLIFFTLFLFIGNIFAEKGLNFFIEPVSSHTEILAETTYSEIDGDFVTFDIEEFLKLKAFSFGLENLIKYSPNSYFTSTYKVDIFYNNGSVVGNVGKYIAINDCDGFGFTYSIGIIFTKNLGDYFKLGIQPSIGIGYDYIKSKGELYQDYNSWKNGNFGRKYNQINSMLFGEFGITPLFMVGNDKFKIEFGWSFVFKPYWCYYKATASETAYTDQYKKAENVVACYFYNTAKLGLIFSY